jgi:hypothetical protein
LTAERAVSARGFERGNDGLKNERAYRENQKEENKRASQE